MSRAHRDVRRLLLDLYRRLAQASEVEPLLDAILDAAIGLTSASRAFLIVRDEAEAVVARSAGETAAEEAGEEDLSRSILDQTMSTGRRLVVGDATLEPEWRDQLSVRRLGLRSVACLPLSAPTGTIGALYVDAGRSGAFGADDLDLLERFADQASLAIDRLNQERRIRELNHSLEQRLVRAERSLVAARRSGRIAHRLRPLARLLGGSAEMDRARDLLERAALTDVPVLIVGESGTGKRLAARCVHETSPRRNGPLVELDGATIPPALFEAEVFGVVAGAFTGARESRPGMIMGANKGTLLLGGVDRLPAEVQSKLLRVIDTGVVRPLGGEPIRVDVRFVSTASSSLRDLVTRGAFREDLYFRLRGVEVRLPPLRSRPDDVLTLAEVFLAADRGGVTTIRPRARRRLREYSWPGNVRELRAEMRRLAARPRSEITESDLSLEIRTGTSDSGPRAAVSQSLDPERAREAVRTAEREVVLRALRESGGNKTEAARRLHMSRYGLLKKIKRLGIR